MKFNTETGSECIDSRDRMSAADERIRQSIEFQVKSEVQEKLHRFALYAIAIGFATMFIWAFGEASYRHGYYEGQQRSQRP